MGGRTHVYGREEELIASYSGDDCAVLAGEVDILG
jgi:hypothetical protein